MCLWQAAIAQAAQPRQRPHDPLLDRLFVPGPKVASNAGQGFLIDNVSVSSGFASPATVNDDTTGSGPAGSHCATLLPNEASLSPGRHIFLMHIAILKT